MLCPTRFRHLAIALTVLSLAACSQKATHSSDPAPLEVGIQFPPNNAVVNGAVTISAGVFGGSGATVMTFFVNGSSMFTDSTPPYQYIWNPSAHPNGSQHLLQVVGVDSQGDSSSSPIRSVYVNWRLLGTGAGTTNTFNIRGVYARSSDLSVEFRVEFDREWSDYKSASEGVDCSLFLDTDRNKNTGTKLFSFGGSSISIGDIGADYRIGIGVHGDSVWYSGSGWLGGDPPRVVHVLNPGNALEFSVQHGDIGGPTVFDLVGLNVRLQVEPDSALDWMPLSGHLSYVVDMLYFGPALTAPASSGSDFAVQQ